MKSSISIVMLLLGFTAHALPKDSTIYYSIPDSLKAISVIADVQLDVRERKSTSIELTANDIKLVLTSQKNKKQVRFIFHKDAALLVSGLHTAAKKETITWSFDGQPNSRYQLLITSAVDSAERFVLYSGYIYLGHLQKWKLIGTCKRNGVTDYMTQVSSTIKKPSGPTAAISNVWVQRERGSWKTLSTSTSDIPSISWMSNLDSIEQEAIDKKRIEQAIVANVIKPYQNLQGVYYNIENPGNGHSFTVNDSIRARYQLRIFGSPNVISGSATEAYTFSLKALIKGWQLAVPLVKTGGKIRLLIPSGMGYSIRTRSSKIPPNSILDFEIDVLDAMAPVAK